MKILNIISKLLKLFKFLGKPEKNNEPVPIKKNKDIISQKENINIENPNLMDKSLDNIQSESVSNSINEQTTNKKFQDEKPTEAIIGFDFGSSCSKVVVNFPTYDKKFAIDFDFIGHESNSFLLPTIIYIDGDGNLSIEKSNNKICYKDFKTKLSNNSEKICNEKYQLKYIDIAIAYIAIVLRIVKQKINESNEIPSKNIDWHLNLGIPSASHNDEKIRDIFLKLAYSAWFISENSNIINSSNLMNSKNEINRKNFKTAHIDNINVVSEIAAEVVGYAQSSERRDGLYILIDIGSRTIDISSFKLDQEDGEDKYCFLTAEVGELGTFYLHEERLKKQPLISEEKKITPNNNVNIEDSVSPLPNFLHYFENNQILNNKDEIHFLNKFYQKSRSFLAKTFVDLRKKRDPNAPEWSSGLPIFLCGGGKNIYFYNHIIDSIEKSYLNNQIKSKLIRKQLPITEKIGYNNKNIDRIAVAYGLSFRKLDIGEIFPPSTFDDINYASFEYDNSNKLNLIDADYW